MYEVIEVSEKDETLLHITGTREAHKNVFSGFTSVYQECNVLIFMLVFQ